jgi:hypothetical protein
MLNFNVIAVIWKKKRAYFVIASCYLNSTCEILHFLPLANKIGYNHFWIGLIKVWTIENNTNLNSIFCVIKSSKIDFISLPAFYLIMWLMTSSKNFEKMTTGFVLRCQNLLRWNTPEMMHFQAWNFLFSPILPLW